MAEYQILKNKQPRSWLTLRQWWQTIRIWAIWVLAGLATVFVFLAILTILDWLWFFFNRSQSPVIVLSTLITLLLTPYLRRWAQNFIDFLFFPETANFKPTIDQACHTLLALNDLSTLKRFLSDRLPARLHVDYILLTDTDDASEPELGVVLPLAMGERSLGKLYIGPKRSMRSFAPDEIQALKQLQEQVSLVFSVINLREARETAEVTAQLKSNFLTNISHELRTPLNSVINSTGLVADGLLGPISPDQAEFLQRAVNGSEHLMRLLDEILDITKIETGQLTLRREVIDLKEVVESALSMAHGMINDKPVQLHAEIAADLPPALADHLRIRQILLNLLSNALKFTKEGYILVKAWADPSRVYVSVTDTGVGIDEADVPLIFQDYQQVFQKNGQPQTRRRHLGTGLGMSITRALVELHGGRLKVESRLGYGSTFTFTLPIALEIDESLIN